MSWSRSTGLCLKSLTVRLTRVLFELNAISYKIVLEGADLGPVFVGRILSKRNADKYLWSTPYGL